MTRAEWTGPDVYGRMRLHPSTEGMSSPVLCAWCGGVYDLQAVTVTARYVDCSMWNAPCCGRQVDDRGETGWKSLKDYERIEVRRG